MPAGPIDARFVVAADGLHSRIREAAGLSDAVAARSRRFGLRRHVGVAPWTDHVEVHFRGDVEAYVTPVGPGEVGIALLWDAGGGEENATFDGLLASFPLLARRVEGCAASSEARGAGPMLHRARAVVRPGLALVGDAAGYVDAITGEGISLALETAAVLVEELAREREGVMRAYARAHRRAFREYAGLAHALLWIARRPRLRRSIVDLLSVQPWAFERVLRRALPAARAGRARSALAAEDGARA